MCCCTMRSVHMAIPKIYEEVQRQYEAYGNDFYWGGHHVEATLVAAPVVEGDPLQPQPQPMVKKPYTSLEGLLECPDLYKRHHKGLLVMSDKLFRDLLENSNPSPL